MMASSAWAASVVTETKGIEGAILQNVRAHLGVVAAESLDSLSVWRLRRLSKRAPDEIRSALQPFGYYQPQIQIRLTEPAATDAPWTVRIHILPGPATTIKTAQIGLTGEGENDATLQNWRDDWPLGHGSVLVHSVYQRALDEVEALARAHGYFDARFAQRRVVVDPDLPTARIEVVFDSGPRYQFGRIDPGNAPFSAWLLNRLIILEPGEPYSVQRVDEQREALVRAGLFDYVAIQEYRRPDDARIDLRFELRERSPNTYRATVGFGTDTRARIQLDWTRHYLSRRGDRLELGVAAQQRYSEYALRAEYRHPFGPRPSDFLTTGIVLRSEQDAFRFLDVDRREPVFERFNGRRDQAELNLGWLRQRRIGARTRSWLEERWFIALLHESFDALSEDRLSSENQALLDRHPELSALLDTSTRTLALGATWRLPSIHGKGFATLGHVFEARFLAAHRAVGSDVSFAQAHLRGRWHYLLGDRHKVLLSGEVGYTEVDTQHFELELDGRFLDLSITRLPERYRFKTGGDRTVRGYGYEVLSSNRNGANHLVQGSLEYEFRVGENWSLAAFYDVGNAFNDFSNMKLNRGAGAGFRFYTMIGPIQVDFARALDGEDQALRLHFTIGTRLL